MARTSKLMERSRKTQTAEAARMTPSQRLKAALELSELARKLQKAGQKALGNGSRKSAR